MKKIAKRISSLAIGFLIVAVILPLSILAKGRIEAAEEAEED
jgi:hypothetical protein